MKVKKKRLPHHVLETLRLRTIEAYRHGHSINEIADVIGVHRGSVSRWITKWHRDGKSALLARPVSGRPRKLDWDKHRRAIVGVVKKSALKFGFETSLWTCARLKTVLASEIGVRISTATMWRTLKALGLSSQKPERRALEQDPIARKKWIEEEWPKIQRLAKAEKAMVFFADEASIALTPTVGRTWGPKGKAPIVRVTGRRGSISVMTAISTSGRLFFAVLDTTIDSEVFINFLKELLAEFPTRKLFVVIDNAKPHKSKKTTEFIEHRSRLRVFRMPPYSPELNPDEKTNRQLKTHELKAHQAKTKDSLADLAVVALQKIASRPGLVRSFFEDLNVT